MSPKLSWEIVKNSLVLTVKDGPKTSQYSIARSTSVQATGDILKGVLKDLGVNVPPPPFGAIPVPPVPLTPLGPVTVQAEPYPQDGPLERDIPVLQMTEGESLEELKQRAYELARRHARFAESEEDAEAALGHTHEYKGPNSIPNVGVTGDVPVGTAIDGTSLKVSDYRPKPQFNVDNHED
jgi:hypothetical protein